MACKTEMIEIGDHKYHVTQWNATRAMFMKVKLIQAFGGVLSALSKAKDEVALLECLSAAFEKSDPAEITKLVKECVIGVARNGTKITDSQFDMVFDADSLIDVYKLFVFVIKVNYQGFMNGQGIKETLSKAKAR